MPPQTALTLADSGDSASMSPPDENGSHKSSPPPPPLSRESLSAAPSGFYFLSAKAIKELPNYVYRGEDQSLFYHYILSPVAWFLVNRCTPRWVAPNTVTLTGLSLMLVSYSIIWYYVPDLKPIESPPRWIFLFNGIVMLIYQTLDNMDGRQARRTKSGSPLGLLFDHGCDAVNSIFGSANWIIAMGLDPIRDAWAVWILVVGPMAIFYVATWEQYYTGELILPIVNGPSEGLALGAMLSMTSFVWGPSFWQGTSWFDSFLQPCIVPLLPLGLQSLIPAAGFSNATLVVAASVTGFVQEMCLKSFHVARKYGTTHLWNLAPMFVMATLFVVIGIYDFGIWIRMPRTSLHLCSALFVEASTQLMLDHITSERFRPMQWSLVPFLILAVLVVTGQVQAGRITDDYLLVYTCALWTYMLMKMTLVIHEICAVLNIWCFDIVTPRKAAGAESHMNGASHTTTTGVPSHGENGATPRKL